MSEIKILRPDTMFSVPAFSQVAVVPPGATTIHVGGQNAVDTSGTLVGDGDLGEQTRQTMANVVTALAAADAGVDDLVSLTILVVEGGDLRAGYAAAVEAIGEQDEPPLVSVAFVAGLAVPGALVEVSALAAVVR